MRNLALKFLGAGFFAEAQMECDKAIDTKDYRTEFEYAIERLRKVTTEEEDKENKVLEGARPKSNFYKLFGRAICLDEPVSLEGQWQGPEYSIEIKVVGKMIEVVGLQTVPASALNALTSVKRTNEDGSPISAGLFGSFDGETKALMVINDASTEITVMEGNEGTNVKFYAWRRQF